MFASTVSFLSFILYLFLENTASCKHLGAVACWTILTHEGAGRLMPLVGHFLFSGCFEAFLRTCLNITAIMYETCAQEADVLPDTLWSL